MSDRYKYIGSVANVKNIAEANYLASETPQMMSARVRKGLSPREVARIPSSVLGLLRAAAGAGPNVQSMVSGQQAMGTDPVSMQQAATRMQQNQLMQQNANSMAELQRMIIARGGR